MWVRKRIDIGWSDLAFGIVRSFVSDPRQAILRRIERHWSACEDAFVCLSIRTGFDLLLGVLRLPPKSEVLMSAVTIHDMVRIVEHHQLIPVPVDLDIDRLAPKLDVLRRAITPATKAIVVAHLYGSRVPMDSLVAVAQEHGLLLIEDCAQAFAGANYKGHSETDVAMFSFGPIKTATALGGAVFRIRSRKLLEQMRTAHDRYPIQGRIAYFRRLLKYGVIKILSTRWFLGAVSRVCRMIGQDHDGLANRVARGFAGPGFFQRIRQQPSAPLLTVLERRLNRFNQEKLDRRISLGRTLIQSLDGSVRRPGADVSCHSHWVFPIEAQCPQKLMRELWRAGFDATQGQSHCVIEPPDDRPWLVATEAEESIERTVFLPFSAEMPKASVKRMAKVVRQAADQTKISIDVQPLEPMKSQPHVVQKG